MAELYPSAEGPSNLGEIKQSQSLNNEEMIQTTIQRSTHDHQSSVEETSKTEIVHLYLTFDRHVPKANTTLSLSQHASSEPPQPPNLAKYGNPLLWPDSRKNTLLLLSCVATFETAYTAGAYSPAQQLMKHEYDLSSTLPVLVGITTFCLGFAFAPMFLAPFSEINGRYPVFVAAGVIFVVFQVVCGLVTNLPGMLIARFFTGVGGSVFSTMVGGVIADMWGKEGRNTPMSLFSGSVLVGTGAGPLIGAIMTSRLGYGTGISAPWKWIFWHQVIMETVLMLFLVFLFKESRGSVLLSRKAKALNKWYGELETAGFYGLWMDASDLSESGSVPSLVSQGLSDEDKGYTATSTSRLQRIRWVVKEDEDRTSLAKMISVSVYRPFHLLVTEPVVFFFSLWVSFAWAVLYLTFGSIPLVFQRQHTWDIERAGYVFMAITVGGVIATIIGVGQERLLHHPQWQAPLAASDSSGESMRSGMPSKSTSPFWHFMRTHFPADAPESRLYFTCVTSMLLPIGLYMFGFTSRPDVHWIVPVVSIVLATIGIYSVYLATFNYLADTYHKYASSALAAQSFCRNVLGGVFPLVTAPLFKNLGEGNAGAVLGTIAAALTVVPWVLVLYGSRIRAKSRIASELQNS